MYRLVVCVGLVCLPVTPLRAQQRPTSLEAWSTHTASEHAAPATAPLRLSTVKLPRRDYRYEGLALGGITLGALGAWVGSQITEACPTEPGVNCAPDRLGNAMVVGLATAVVGGGLGYVIGRLSSRPSPAAVRGTAP